MTERGEMEAAIEAILFVSSEPVPRTRLIEMFDDDEREQAAAALAAVLERYAGGEARGVMVEDVAGGDDVAESRGEALHLGLDRLGHVLPRAVGNVAVRPCRVPSRRGAAVVEE